MRLQVEQIAVTAGLALLGGAEHVRLSELHVVVVPDLKHSVLMR